MIVGGSTVVGEGMAVGGSHGGEGVVSNEVSRQGAWEGGPHRSKVETAAGSHRGPTVFNF
jgi:hypothetical protein